MPLRASIRQAAATLRLVHIDHAMVEHPLEVRTIALRKAAEIEIPEFDASLLHQIVGSGRVLAGDVSSRTLEVRLELANYSLEDRQRAAILDNDAV